LQDFIQKQFSLRRKSSCEENEETSAKYSRVRAADSTGIKVNGLTVNVSMFILTENSYSSLISYSQDGRIDQEVASRVQRANNAYFQMNNIIFGKRELEMKTKT
jgi:hypothetical protein